MAFCKSGDKDLKKYQIQIHLINLIIYAENENKFKDIDKYN